MSQKVWQLEIQDKDGDQQCSRDPEFLYISAYSFLNSAWTLVATGKFQELQASRLSPRHKSEKIKVKQYVS